MVGVPLAARVVEVIADRGEDAEPRYRYGSGCIVRGRTVLTAAHVVADARIVRVRYPDKELRPGRVDARFVGGGVGPDLALVDIDDDEIELAAIELAVVDRDSPTAMLVEGCHAVGYPWFAESPSPSAVRDTVDAWGYVPVLSRLVSGLLTVRVADSPRPLPPERTALGESQWSGMSGAPVIAGECLLGVVSEHAAREGPSAITAVPLSALESDPAHPEWGPGVSNAGEWWARLGVSGLKGLRRLPARTVRREPTYWATVQEIQKRTPQLLGREQELALLTHFATGPAGYLWLIAPPWAGKTALVAEVCTTGRPPSVDVVAYFLSRREGEADSNRFLAAVVPQLAYLFDEDQPVPGLHQFRALWYRAAERAETTGRHLLLVVSGLDEELRLRGVPGVSSLLPAHLGANAHVLITSRPDPPLESEVPPGHPLRAADTVRLKPFASAGDRAEMAKHEMDDLLHGDDADLAAEVLGVLTAAAGALTIDDLATLTADLVPTTPAWSRQVDRFVATLVAAGCLQPTGPPDRRRYQFAHSSLLSYAKDHEWLRHPDYRHRIDRWADKWRDAGWPVPAGEDGNTPRYLLDGYPVILKDRPQRLAALASDVGWVVAAVATVGVDRVLADLSTAQSIGAALPEASALLAALRSQAHNLRPPQPVDQPGYVLRQLCLQAARLADDRLAADARRRLMQLEDPVPVPLWTTHRASRALLAEFGNHTQSVAAVASLPDGRVVSAGYDGRVQVWDPAMGAVPTELCAADGGVNAIAVLPDRRVVIGGDHGQVRICDTAGSVEIGRHRKPVYALAALPDGRVVSGGGDGRVRIWDPGKATVPVELGRHAKGVSALAALPDGRVISGGGDGRVCIWDPGKATVPVELGHHDGWVFAVGVLQDGRVISGGDDGRIQLYDPAAAGHVDLGGHDGWVWTVAPLPDGRVVSGGGDGRVRIWDPARVGSSPVELGNHRGRARAVAVLPDGCVISGGDDKKVQLWDPNMAGSTSSDGSYASEACWAVTIMSDGRLVSGGDDGRVRLWDPASKASTPVELGRHLGRVRAVAVLPGGQVVSGGDDRRVRLWNPTAAEAGDTELGLHDGWVFVVAALPDGRVASGGDTTVRIWDPAASGSGPAELIPHHGPVRALAVLADGRVVSGGETLHVWNLAGSRARSVELSYDGGLIKALAALPDGRVISGGDDGRLLLWRSTTQHARPVELGNHQGGVLAVAVLPSRRVVSTGKDRQVRIWDITTCTEFTRIAYPVVTLATTAQPGAGKGYLVLAHEDGSISEWLTSLSASLRGSARKKDHHIRPQRDEKGIGTYDCSPISSQPDYVYLSARQRSRHTWIKRADRGSCAVIKGPSQCRRPSGPAGCSTLQPPA